MSSPFLSLNYSNQSGCRDGQLYLQQGAVAVAEETVIMVEGMTVDVTPTAFGKGTDKKKKRGLRLVEIGDEVFDDVKVITRCNDDLGGGMKSL